jgi:ATP-dependent Clp protease ATP-binding subunit ClpA
LSLVLAPGAYDALILVGHSAEFGVREMERIMETQIVNPLAVATLQGRFPRGGTVFVVADANGVVLSDSAA